MTDAPQAPEGLAALEARVQRDLQHLDYFSPSWVRAREGVFDVVIIGGGQSGLGAAFGLMREKVRNILVVDENPAGLEGPWATYARMLTLRTPKQVTAIDFGMGPLTPRAWWEAQYGAASWESLEKIPRDAWMAYLRWFRAVLAIPVRNETRVSLIEPMENGVHRLRLDGGGELLARKVVLATGIQGGGEWHTPDFIKQSLPAHRYAHTSQPIDFDALKGRRIAILGGGASAFDNAQHALAAGAAQAHVFIRRPELPTINPIRFMERVGFIRHYPGLDDATKYAVTRSFMVRNQPPTNDTFERSAAYPGFSLFVETPWLAVREAGEAVVVTTPKGELTYDFLVLSTGTKTDAGLRPELAAVADDIALWKHRYQPPPEEALPAIGDHPYLGPGFELQARTPECAARLWGLFAFNYSALVSLGLSAAALSGLRFSLPKLVSAITGQLFMDDRDAILADFFGYDTAEFVGRWPKPAED